MHLIVGVKCCCGCVGVVGALMAFQGAKVGHQRSLVGAHFPLAVRVRHRWFRSPSSGPLEESSASDEATHPLASPCLPVSLARETVQGGEEFRREGCSFRCSASHGLLFVGQTFVPHSPDGGHTGPYQGPFVGGFGVP